MTHCSVNAEPIATAPDNRRIAVYVPRLHEWKPAEYKFFLEMQRAGWLIILDSFTRLYVFGSVSHYAPLYWMPLEPEAQAA